MLIGADAETPFECLAAVLTAAGTSQRSPVQLVNKVPTPGTCPVEQVNWHEAAAYCNALSVAKGYSPCYSCSGSGADVTCQEASAYSGQNIYSCPGYRLPTEAEWERAYRAGSSTAYYSGANDANACGCEGDVNAEAIGWYCANSNDTSHPVGQKQANAWGLYARDKSATLQEANRQVNSLRYLFRLAKDMKVLSINRYEHGAKHLVEIGQQIGGWRKSSARRAS